MQGGSIYAYTNPLYIDNHICPFSSSGITVDGRSLPHVAGPGAAIISSCSKYYYANNGLTPKNISAEYTWNNREHQWIAEQGTSMSSPVVAGTIALWLEADPTLTPQEVINVFKESSTRPEESLTDNNTAWGNGKIEALKGLKYILSQNSVNDITADRHNPIVTPTTDGYEIFAAGYQQLSATVYNLSGQPVARASENGETLMIKTDNLPAGIYILSIDGTDFAQRIAVK